MNSNEIAWKMLLFSVLVVTGIAANCVSAQSTKEVSTGVEDSSELASEYDQVPDSTWETIEAMYEVLSQEAYRPQTKQQVVLQAAMGFCKHAGQPISRESLAAISELSSADELRRWLDPHWNRLHFRSEYTVGQINEGLGRDLLQQLEPYSQFVTAKEFRVRQQLAENQYVGIGIRIGQEGDYSMIVDPFPGGAARQAGARSGDLIVSIDGKSTEGMSLGQVVEALRGPQGSSLTVTVKNRDGSEPRLLDMVRDVVPIATIHGHKQRDDGTWSYALNESKRIAYLRFDNVVGSTAAELQEVSRDEFVENAKGVVLDFSNVSDGDLHHVTMLADTLLGATELGTVEFVSQPPRKIETREERVFANLPLVVLTPPQASGPLFAALLALKQRPDTLLIGHTTASDRYCLGSFPLRDGLGGMEYVRFARFEPFASLEAENQQDGYPVNRHTDFAGSSRLVPDREVPEFNAMLLQAMAWFESNE